MSSRTHGRARGRASPGGGGHTRPRRIYQREAAGDPLGRRSESGAECDAELAVFVDAATRIVTIEPQAGPQRHAGAECADRTSGANKTPAHTRTHAEPRSERHLAS